MRPYLGSMTGLSYTLGDSTVIVPELSGFKTTGPCIGFQTATKKKAAIRLLPLSRHKFREVF
jgi:hypothetical protein